MLHNVKNPNADKILPLLQGDSYALFAQAVLNGNAKGTVYVDDIQNPTVAAILSHEEERCYLTLQSAGNDLKTWQTVLSETVLRDQFEENGAAMEMFLHPEADNSVHDIFRTMEAAWNPAYLFSWNNDRSLEPPSAIPDGFILQPVTQAFLNSKNIENLDLILDEWCERTDNVNGVRGFCLLKENTVASVCHIDFHNSDAVEIGIITDQNYRRQGLAVVVVSNTIQYFKEHGIRHIIWHAPADNKGSCAVAARSGLTIEREFGEYWMHYTHSCVLLLHAHHYFRSGKFREAAEYYRRALRAEKNEIKPFAGWHERIEVLSWILEYYNLLQDEDSLGSVLSELPAYNIRLSAQQIEAYEKNPDHDFITHTDTWQRWKNRSDT